MKLLVAIFSLLTFVGHVLCRSCSTYQAGRETMARLTRLTPLVLRATVVSTDNKTRPYSYYNNATLNVTYIYKLIGAANVCPLIKVIDFSRDDEACRDGKEYIFLLEVNPFRARYNVDYDAIESAVHPVTCDALQGISDGLCTNIFTPGEGK